MNITKKKGKTLPLLNNNNNISNNNSSTNKLNTYNNNNHNSNNNKVLNRGKDLHNPPCKTLTETLPAIKINKMVKEGKGDY